jgi:hypothetical protein
MLLWDSGLITVAEFNQIMNGVVPRTRSAVFHNGTEMFQSGTPTLADGPSVRADHKNFQQKGIGVMSNLDEEHERQKKKNLNGTGAAFARRLDEVGGMSRAEYLRQRRELARELGVPVSLLDEEYKRARLASARPRCGWCSRGCMTSQSTLRSSW